MLGLESFTACTAEPRMVQLGGGGTSAITKALDPYAACHCRGNPLQQRDSAAGRGREQQNSGARANHTTAGRRLGRQTVASLPPSWAGHLNGHRK